MGWGVRPSGRSLLLILDYNSVFSLWSHFNYHPIDYGTTALPVTFLSKLLRLPWPRWQRTYTYIFHPEYFIWENCLLLMRTVWSWHRAQAEPLICFCFCVFQTTRTGQNKSKNVKLSVYEQRIVTHRVDPRTMQVMPLYMLFKLKL